MAVELTIVKIDNPKQNFNGGLTTYATFQTVTADGNPIPVAVTHGMLQRNSINPMFLKPLVGSKLIVEDNNSEDLKTKIKTFTSAEQRVSDVINKVPKRSIILLNPTNGSIITSENFDTVAMEMINTVTAKVQVEENKAERLARQMRATENLRASLGLQIAAPITETVTAAAPELEVNEDEIPF